MSANFITSQVYNGRAFAASDGAKIQALCLELQIFQQLF
jgi:hypothetical protein